MLMAMTHSPMLASLLRWGDVKRRWREVAHKISESTTTVKGGFHGSHWELFQPQKKVISEKHFTLYSQLVAVLLNIHMLQKGDLPPFCKNDSKLYALLCAARARLNMTRQDHEQHSSEKQFRTF